MVVSAVCLLPWRSLPPPPLASFRSQQEAHSVSDRPIELCSAGASATWRRTTCALPVAQQKPSQLVVHSDFQDFCHQAATHVTWEMHLGYTPGSSVSFPSVCLLLRSLFFSTISASSPPSSFPSSGPSAWDAVRFRPGQKGWEPAWARPAAVQPGTERPSAKLTVLAGPPPVSVPSQGPCCGPVLLFTQPPPDPLNCR